VGWGNVPIHGHAHEQNQLSHFSSISPAALIDLAFTVEKVALAAGTDAAIDRIRTTYRSACCRVAKLAIVIGLVSASAHAAHMGL
jgi:hypothetical protein